MGTIKGITPDAGVAGITIPAFVERGEAPDEPARPFAACRRDYDPGLR